MTPFQFRILNGSFSGKEIKTSFLVTLYKDNLLWNRCSTYLTWKAFNALTFTPLQERKRDRRLYVKSNENKETQWRSRSGRLLSPRHVHEIISLWKEYSLLCSTNSQCSSGALTEFHNEQRFSCGRNFKVKYLVVHISFSLSYLNTEPKQSF